MDIIFSLWALLVIIVPFINLNYGLAIYLSYMLLVPAYGALFFGINIPFNLVNVLLLIAFFLKRGKKSNFIYWPLLPFAMYFVACLILIFVQANTPLDWELEQWRKDVMRCLILPFILLNQLMNEKKGLNIILNTILLCVGINAFYSLFVVFLKGLNPYVSYVGSLFQLEDLTMYYMSSVGRSFGRVSGVFYHPMTNGLFIGFSLVFSFIYNKWLKKKWILFLQVVLFMDALLCGIRSVLVGLVIAMCVYLVLVRKIRLLSYTLFLCCIVYLICNFIPGLDTYLDSIINSDNSTQVSGSSASMRLEQLEGCFDEIKNNLLIGNGYGWKDFYMSKYGDHPVILAFESLIFVVLCNTGLCGILLWIIMGLKYCRSNIKKLRESSSLLITLFAFYIGYACITGDFGYMPYFLVFYTVSLSLMLKEKNNVKYFSGEVN